MSDWSVLVERWRMLTDEQQGHVLSVLTRGVRDALRWGEKAKAEGSRPEPYGRYRREAAMRHAANAGALRIARDLLDAIGCVDDRRPKGVLPRVCPDCAGRGRVPCECLRIVAPEDVVTDPDCERCGGVDGDYECPLCDGRGAVLEVSSGMTLEEAIDAAIKEDRADIMEHLRRRLDAMERARDAWRSLEILIDGHARGCDGVLCACPARLDKEAEG